MAEKRFLTGSYSTHTHTKREISIWISLLLLLLRILLLPLYQFHLDGFYFIPKLSSWSISLSHIFADDYCHSHFELIAHWAVVNRPTDRPTKFIGNYNEHVRNYMFLSSHVCACARDQLVRWFIWNAYKCVCVCVRERIYLNQRMTQAKMSITSHFLYSNGWRRWWWWWFDDDKKRSKYMPIWYATPDYMIILLPLPLPLRLLLLLCFFSAVFAGDVFTNFFFSQLSLEIEHIHDAPCTHIKPSFIRLK